MSSDAMVSLAARARTRSRAAGTPAAASPPASRAWLAVLSSSRTHTLFGTTPRAMYSDMSFAALSNSPITQNARCATRRVMSHTDVGTKLRISLRVASKSSMRFAFPRATNTWLDVSRVRWKRSWRWSRMAVIARSRSPARTHALMKWAPVCKPITDLIGEYAQRSFSARFTSFIVWQSHRNLSTSTCFPGFPPSTALISFL
mmetsp:Transcript_60634/g.144177  ORF Transcript_60634/g.144177 Transcript_60634/m.144177 type:complete len:202 (-) Transcript_60634:356-961(-)